MSLGQAVRVGMLGCILAGSSMAAVTFPITIIDPGNTYSAYHEPIARNLAAACDEWGRYMQGTAAIQIEVRFERQQNVLMFAGANTVAYVGRQGSYNVWDQGPTAEIRTGVDPNGSEADGTVWINPDYLSHFWFDPASTISPTSSSVPRNKYDAYSIFLHEMGHVLGFNGWLEQSSSNARQTPTVDEQGRPIPYRQYLLTNDAPPGTVEMPSIPAQGRLAPVGNDISTYDQLVTSHLNGTVTFDGPYSLQQRSGGVPLEPTSYVHLSLPHSTMYSYGEYGVRNKLSGMELAILKDLGMNITIPLDQCVPDLDTDGDGLGDCVDASPGTQTAMDSDGDGVPDASDACPDDSAKSSNAGACGCGQPETDSDGDGIADCVDPVDDRIPTVPDDTDDTDSPSTDDEQVLGFQPTLPTAGCGAGATGAALSGLLIIPLIRRRFA